MTTETTIHKTTLWDISGALANIAPRMEAIANDLELSDAEKDQAIAALMVEMDQMREAAPQKFENIAHVLESLEATIKARQEAKRKQDAGIRSAESQIAWLKKYALDCLKVIEGGKVKTPLCSAWIGKSKKLEITDLQLLPSDRRFWRFKDPEPNAKEISDAIKNGETITGAKIIESEHICFK